MKTRTMRREPAIIADETEMRLRLPVRKAGDLAMRALGTRPEQRVR